MYGLSSKCHIGQKHLRNSYSGLCSGPQKIPHPFNFITTFKTVILDHISSGYLFFDLRKWETPGQFIHVHINKIFHKNLPQTTWHSASLRFDCNLPSKLDLLLSIPDITSDVWPCPTCALCFLAFDQALKFTYKAFLHQLTMSKPYIYFKSQLKNPPTSLKFHRGLQLEAHAPSLNIQHLIFTCKPTKHPPVMLRIVADHFTSPALSDRKPVSYSSCVHLTALQNASCIADVC